MSDIWFLARKNLRYMLQAKESFLWMFVMPVVFMAFIGRVTSNFGPSGSSATPLALASSGQAGFLAERLVRRLEEGGYRVLSPEDDSFPSAKRRLTVPDDFTTAVLAGGPSAVRFEREDEGNGGDYDTIRVGRAVYTTLADLIASAEDGSEPTAESLARLDALPRALTLDVKQAGKRRVIPTGYEQAVPGIMVMFTLINVLTTAAVTLVIERRQGLLRRLASTPISRQRVVAGRLIANLILALVQVLFAMLVGSLLFEVDWGPDLPMIGLVLIGWAALCAALGLLVGSLSSSEGQAVGIGVLSTNVLAALGGCWWPIEITPGWMQTLAGFLPTGWAMDALHRLVSFQAGAASALPHLAALAGAALLTSWLAARFFRFQ